MSSYHKGSNLIYYDLSSISEKKVKPWLTEYLTNEYRALVKTRGSFVLNDDNQFDECFIPIIISGEKPKKRYKYSNNELARKIVHVLENREIRSPEDAILKIEEILERKTFTDNIVGCYCNDNCPIVDFDYPTRDSKPYIILYYHNFSYSTDEELKVAISNCLAHEYFHFHHNLLIGDNFNVKPGGRGNHQRNAVIESLADFFSFVYTLLQCKVQFCKTDSHIDYAKNQFDKWVDKFGSNWPYAYSYCFFFNRNGRPVLYSQYYEDYVGNGCKEKFNDVINDSKDGMSKAYKTLGYRNEYMDLLGIY